MFMDHVAEQFDAGDGDQLTDFREANGYEWPNCDVPDCENKACVWAGTGRCHPCSVRLVGREEMDRRYSATRISPTDRAWNGQVARDPS
jgi:hypothetical protein